MNTVNINSKIDGISQINVSADAEIMQNYQGAYPVAADHRISAVQDNAGNPMVFALSDDGDFYLMLHDASSPTGWAQIDLSTALPGQPATFSVNQLSDGDITLAVSIPDANDATTENLYLCGPLSADATQTPWADLSPYWLNAGNPQTGTSIQDLYIAPVSALTTVGIPFLAVSLKTADNLGMTDYILQPDIESGLSWDWLDFPTPTDKKEMLAYALGNIDDLGLGVYMLYTNTSDESTLIFKTFDAGHGSFVRSLTAPANATTLQTAVINGQTTTALFVGGTEGITYFSPSNQDINATGVSIASAEFIPVVEANGLIVRQDTSNSGIIAVWALSGENLMYFTNSEDDPETWTQPVTFLSGIAQFTAIRNNQRLGNELIYICTDLAQNPSVKYMWQDPNTTKWQKEEIPLSDTGQTYEYNCFTSTLAFVDENNLAIANLPVTISASYWSRIQVNGTAHIVDTGASISAVTDSMGNLTIINTTSDFSCPIFTISEDSSKPSFDGSLTINPVYKAYEKLSTVQSADDIPDYLYDPSDLPDGITTDDVADMISQLTALEPNGETMQDGCIVYHSDAPAARVKTGKKRKAPVGFSLSLRTGHAGYYRHNANGQSAAMSKSVVGTIWDDTVDAIGDLWQFAETVVEEVTDMVLTVVEDVVKFTIYLVDQTIEIIIETIEDVLKTIWYIFKALAVLFVDLIKWLGFLFDLEDIWTMHKVLSNLMTDSVNYFLDAADTEVDSWKDDVRNGFTELKENFAQLILPNDIANSLVYDSTNTLIAENPSVNFNSVGTNWSFFQMFHGGGLTGSLSSDSDAPFNIDDHPALQILNDSILPIIKDINRMMVDIDKALQDLFTGNPSINDILLVLNDFMDAIFDAVEGLVLAFLDVVEDVLSLLQSILCGTIHIPFFTSLYEWLTGLFGDEEDLNMANIISLVAAFPVTILYKLLAEVSPFVNGTCGLDQPGVFNTLINGPTTSKTTAMAASSSSSIDEDAMKSLYVDIGGIATAFISPLLDALNIFSFSLSKRHEKARLDDDADAMKAIESQIGFITATGIVLYIGKIGASFPVALNKSDAGDNLSYFNYGLTATSIIVPFIAMPTPRLAGGIGSGISLVQFALAMVIDVCDGESGIKYIQDCLACLGSAANGAGIALEGYSEGLGLGLRMIGMPVLLLGDTVLAIRTVGYITGLTEDMIRVQNG